VSSRVGEKPASLMVRGSAPPLIQTGTCCMSRARRASVPPPYSSPNTPHQYHCANLRRMASSSN
jgi:hypothetical protein